MIDATPTKFRRKRVLALIALAVYVIFKDW